MLLYHVKNENKEAEENYAETVIDLHKVKIIQCIKDEDGFNIALGIGRITALVLFDNEKAMRKELANIYKLLDSSLNAKDFKIVDRSERIDKQKKMKKALKDLLDD